MAGKDPTTPTKRKLNEGEDTCSPRTKERLEFDWWSARKVPKIVIEDLKAAKLTDLKPARTVRERITLKCYGVFDSNRIFKIAATDGHDNIVITDFTGESSKLRSCIKGKCYMMSGFEVKKENPAYTIGSPNGIEIICSTGTTIQPADDESVELSYNFTNLEMAKAMPDNTRIDILGVIVRVWEATTLANGQKKLSVSVTDKTMNTMNVTIWGAADDDLQDLEGKVIALRQAVVQSYLEMKCLQTKWWTYVQITLENEVAKDLHDWFQQKINEDE